MNYQCPSAHLAYGTSTGDTSPLSKFASAHSSLLTHLFVSCPKHHVCFTEKGSGLYWVNCVLRWWLRTNATVLQRHPI